MPKSKRNKQVDLTKTKKHGIEGKKNLYGEIRTCVDMYAHVFVFSVNDMRNSKMKQVREQWKHSRFFIGKNKVMAIALGRYAEESYRNNLHKIGEQLKGQKGLLFSNQSVDEVLKFFSSYSEGDFARSGNVATEDVTLSEGPLAQFPHSLESYLRQLGLPTTLKKGVIHLVKDHVVCKNAEQLTPETARILKLLGYEMAEFQIRMECVWSQDGTFQDLRADSVDVDFKENLNDSFKGSIMNEEFQLVLDVAGLGDEEEEEEMELDENGAKITSVAEKETLEVRDVSSKQEPVQVIKNRTSVEVRAAKVEMDAPDSNQKTEENEIEIAESNAEVESDILLPNENKSQKDSDRVEEPSDLKKRSLKKKNRNLKSAEDEAEESDSSEQSEIDDGMGIIKIGPTKYSPKMTRARAAATKKDDPKPPASAAKTPRAAASKKDNPKPPASAAKTSRAAASKKDDPKPPASAAKTPRKRKV